MFIANSVSFEWLPVKPYTVSIVPHLRQIDPEEVLQISLKLLEKQGPDALSLRAVAALLGVKAPSLYRHFKDKTTLEQAVAVEVCRHMLEYISKAVADKRKEEALRAFFRAYLQYARKWPSLYFFAMQEGSLPNQSSAGKDLWNFVLAVIGDVSGNKDDTSTAVAAWSFLHGFAALERNGRFGKSGPQDGFNSGLTAILLLCRTSAGTR